MAALDLTGLRPLDTSGLQEVTEAPGLDVGGLKPLDVTGLSEVKREPMTFLGSMGRGVDVAQGMGYGFIEATGEALGSESVRKFGEEGRVRNVIEADQYGDRSKFLGIRDAGDAGQWAKETVGERIPIMAPAAGGALVGGGLGALTGPFAPIGIPLGAAIGAFVPSFVMGVGEVQGNIKEKDPNAQAPGWAFTGGSAIAALEFRAAREGRFDARSADETRTSAANEGDLEPATGPQAANAIHRVRLETDRRFLRRREEQQRVGGARQLLDERATVRAGSDVNERAGSVFSGRDP